jgi:hypothetical protein
MRRKELIKIFANQQALDNANKIDRKIKNLIKFLNNVLIVEIFDKYYMGFENKSKIQLKEIQNNIIEINNLLYKRKIVEACRRMKGLMEDCIAFICQNYDINSIEINSETRAKDFREYIINNNSKFLSILNEEVSKEYDYLTQMYNYIAKIDHPTSIKFYTKNLEQEKRIKNIQYSYCSIITFLLFLLFDFRYTKKNSKNNSDTLFIIKTIMSLSTIISISFIINYDNKKYLNIKIISSLDNSTDEKYLNDLSEWNKRVLAKVNTKMTEGDKKLLNDIFKSYDDELRIRNYLKEELKEGEN